MPPSETLKIVRIITRLNVGGPAQQAAALSAVSGNPGWATLLITGPTGPSEGNMDYLLEGRPIRHLRLRALQRPLHPARDLAALCQILRCLLRERPAVLHTHTAKAGTLGRVAGKIYRLLTGRPLKMFHTFHGHVLEGYFAPAANELFIRIERWLAKGTTGLIAVSESVRDNLAALRVAPASKIEVVHLGLPLERLLSLPLPQPGPPLQVGLVGRMVPIKNHRMFLEAVRILGKQGDGMRFLLYGDGELRAGLEKKASGTGAGHPVRFMGWQTNLESLYQSLQMVCLTSLNEGTPVSLIEAMAAARPVVATDVGGVKDLMGNRQESGCSFQLHERGILVRSGDSAGLAEALRFLAGRPDLRRRLGLAGREFARGQFTLQKLTQRLDRLYREACVS